MTAPKRRLSKTRRDSRRAHDSLTKPQVAACNNCGEMTRPHLICRHCGHYNGRQYKAEVGE
jgi:large subunit ribosomal protein L32